MDGWIRVATTPCRGCLWKEAFNSRTGETCNNIAARLISRLKGLTNRALNIYFRKIESCVLLCFFFVGIFYFFFKLKGSFLFNIYTKLNLILTKFGQRNVGLNLSTRREKKSVRILNCELSSVHPTLPMKSEITTLSHRNSQSSAILNHKVRITNKIPTAWMTLNSREKRPPPNKHWHKVNQANYANQRQSMQPSIIHILSKGVLYGHVDKTLINLTINKYII